jgi:HAD superfamily hydrolase (TIGR01509 family)
MANIEAIALDFSGVLADSRQAHTIARQRAMKLYAVQNSLPSLSSIPNELHEQAYLRGDSSKSIMSWLLDQVGIVLETNALDAISAMKKNEFNQLAQKGLPPLDGAIDYVRWVSDQLTPAKVGIASRSSYIETFLQRHGIDDAVGYIVNAEQTPRQLRKPHPYAYQRLASLMNVSESNTLSVDDSPEGVEAARAAGTFMVGITTTHPSERIAAAHIIVNDFTELHMVTQKLLD